MSTSAPARRTDLESQSVVSGALGASASPVGDAVSVQVSGGVMPFTVEVGPQSQSKRSRTFAFMGVGSGEHVVLIADADGRSFDTKVVIP